MKRFTLLSLMFTLAVAMFAVPCAWAADPVKLVFASAYAPVDHQSQTLVKFGELAEKYSNGALKVVSPSAASWAVSAMWPRDPGRHGERGDSGRYPPELRPGHVHSRVPLPLQTTRTCGPSWKGRGRRIRARLIAKTNIRILYYVMRTPRELTTRDPVKSLADVKGMKIRVPEMQAHLETWRALGPFPRRWPSRSLHGPAAGDGRRAGESSRGHLRQQVL